ncbi:hypothetical protein PSYMO_11525 [Pseudomonas amygdali pv. mori str. 301020]|jgi:hypothetical protein|uniref:Uncharacterized protein n=1 Tax=Pseudomonas amygdali pv. mori str. 301020 TaxID=629261 RepID=A0A656G7S5_PSEA0|nr:hypothetical protein PSYMO_11525 [Pseudomonas amygdali pv. mori str. 301020]
MPNRARQHSSSLIIQICRDVLNQVTWALRIDYLKNKGPLAAGEFFITFLAARLMASSLP